ncbi:MAG TPA: hypothetical protein VNQ76_15510 [Planctomicrobium sp.]|nr:hypothetical protein [Planctomicrobium sp.]
MNPTWLVVVRDRIPLSPHLLRKIVLFGVIVCCPGCLASPQGEIIRYQLKGDVIFDGQPVPQGTIQLTPDTQKGNSGPGSTGIIENGKFTIPAQRGIVGGSYIVLISGYDSSPIPMDEATGSGSPLFEEYRILVELPHKSSVQDFSIPKE